MELLRARAKVHQLSSDCGWTVQEIAEKMQLRERTVLRYLAAVVPKVSRGQLSSAWMEDAACLSEDRSLFFPSVRGVAAIEAKAKAVRICVKCPVAAQCHRFAESNYETNGVWGGEDFTHVSWNFDEVTGEVFRDDGAVAKVC